MLHLILGGAGSGKSTRLTAEISADIAAGRRAWLIIPEQQANLSERTMLPKLPASAGLTFTITGFSRLASEVSSRYGGQALAPLSRGLSSLLMWQALRTATPLLQEYQSVSLRADSKLTDMLLATVDELRACAVTPQQLLRAAEQLPENAALRPKLTDLAMLYESYDASLAEAFDGGSIDEVARLSELLSEHDYFRGGHVYIDSFTDFTAEEFDVVRHILRQADKVTLTLCCEDEHTADPSMLSVAATLSRVVELCERDHIDVTREVLTANHRAQSDELRLLERNLWNFSLKKDELPTPADTGAITLLQTANVYAEAEAVALHILDLAHNGTRYGDIAVVFRDSETYRGVLDAALERHGIPFYFSEKTALTEKPLSRLVLSALRAVSRGFQTQDVMTMLKTGLCPVTPAEVDMFEQYVATWRINGAGFTAERWTRNPDGYTETVSPRAHRILEVANHVRETIMTPLLRLHAATSRGGKLPLLSSALYAFMQELGLAERCAELAHAELDAGYLKQAGETVRVFDTVCMTLTQISARLPELSLDIEEFSTVLRMVFDATEIASVPSLHDSVTLGSADTLRVENVEASFVLGLCEGEFPAAIKDAGLLGNAEKELLRPLGIHFDRMQDMQSSSELLFVWRAMTKPSRRLFASTVAADTQDKKKSPSLAYNRLLLLFPYLKSSIRRFDLSMVAPSRTSDASTEPTPTEGASRRDAYTPIEPSPLDPSADIMSRRLGDTLYLSQSKIDRFVQCPYSFYCTYLLDLREKAPARVDAANSGTFVHYVFEHFLRHCIGEDGSFTLPTPEEVEPLAYQIVNDYIRSLTSVTLSDLRTLHTFRRLRDLTVILLRDILDELEKSVFRPVSLEHKIGGKDADSPYYEIELGDGRRILLNGKVDRVDCYRQGDTVYLRVVDYKTNSKTFDLADVKKGLNLQMLIYLFSLCRDRVTVPAGVLYIATASIDSDPKPCRSGLLLDDPVLQDGNAGQTTPISSEAIDRLEHEIEQTLRAIGQDMMAGRAARTPSKEACLYCHMRTSCPDAVKTKNR